VFDSSYHFFSQLEDIPVTLSIGFHSILVKEKVLTCRVADLVNADSVHNRSLNALFRFLVILPYFVHTID